MHLHNSYSNEGLQTGCDLRVYTFHHIAKPLNFLQKDHLSIETILGWFIGHPSDTNAPLYKDHLSTVTTVGWFIGHLSDTSTPLYKDHLSTETTSIQQYASRQKAVYTYIHVHMTTDNVGRDTATNVQPPHIL